MAVCVANALVSELEVSSHIDRLQVFEAGTSAYEGRCSTCTWGGLGCMCLADGTACHSL